MGRHESVTAGYNPVPLPFYARYCAPKSPPEAAHWGSGGAGDGAVGMKGCLLCV